MEGRRGGSRNVGHAGVLLLLSQGLPACQLHSVCNILDGLTVLGLFPVRQAGALLGPGALEPWLLWGAAYNADSSRLSPILAVEPWTDT